MTIYCEGRPVTAKQILSTRHDMESEVLKLQKSGLLPASTKLIDKPGELAAYFNLTENIYYDPAIMSCFPKQEIKAVLLHETGHSHQYVIASTAIGGIVAFELFLRSLKNINKARKKIHLKQALQKKTGKHRNMQISRNLKLALLSGCAWFAVSKMNSLLDRHLEVGADIYAAEVMGTGQVLANGFQRLEDRQISSNRPFKKTWFTYMLSSFEFVRYSIFDPHPNTVDRITYLRAWRPTKPSKAFNGADARK